jgi:hypothetical protein
MDATPSVQIEKGIPLTQMSGGGRNSLALYPWHKMEIGDSFLFPPHINKIDKAQGNKAYGQKATGFKFKCRTTPEGIRCWRIA